MSKTTGIVRNIDSLGRICLPKEYRMLYDMMDGDQVEIAGVEDGVLIRKHAMKCTLCRRADAEVLPIEFYGTEQLICRECIAKIKRIGRTP